MKIVCESCQAKYSIADEKIAGKVFKIRCKRCNEVILVRGDQEPAQEVSSQEGAGGPTDAIWHVVIEGEQRGPYAPDQIGEMLSKAQIDWEAYVWREGMDNWIAACDIPELVTAIMGPDHAQQPQAEDATTAYDHLNEAVPASKDAQAVASSPRQTSSTMGDDPFADNGGSSSGGLFADPGAVSEAGADLFRPSAENSPFSSGNAGAFQGADMAQVSSPRVSMEQAMTGARNENSVLFSLKNLQALATGSTTSTPISAPIAPAPGTGYASGEGSGLIDIRALATATGVAKDGLHEEDRDALFSIGTKTGAFGALGSPIVAPAMGGDEEISKRKVLFAILGGSVFLGLCMIAVAIIWRPSTQPQPVATAVPVVPAVANPAAVKPQTEETAPAALSEGEKAAQAAAVMGKTSSLDREKAVRSAPSIKKKPTKVDEKETAVKAAPTPSAKEEPTAVAKEEPAAKKKKSSGSESIDDLLAGALSGGPKPAAAKSEAPAAAESGLPEKPTREEVMTALRAVQPAVSACGQGQGGVAMAAIVVGSSGRVQSVQVTQVPGPVASCVSRAVRGARFPKFSSPKFSVSFPFRL
jgi:predicted Zn finger-like uncharacterized protein